jgi:hypothetical protein
VASGCGEVAHVLEREVLSSETGTIRGGSVPTMRNRAPRTQSQARVCEEHQCSTVLSRYNLRPRCWQHDTPKPYVLRVRERPSEAGAPDAADDAA